MRAFIQFIIVIAMSSTAIASDKPQQKPEEGPYVPVFLCSGGPLGLHLPEDLPSVMKLAPIEHESTSKDGDYRSVYFHGLKLDLYIFPNDKNKYFVGDAEITNAQWEHIAPFKIGESILSVRQKIGSYADNDPTLKLSYGSEAGDLWFESSDGKIKKIIYKCMVD